MLLAARRQLSSTSLASDTTTQRAHSQPALCLLKLQGNGLTQAAGVFPQLDDDVLN